MLGDFYPELKGWVPVEPPKPDQMPSIPPESIQVNPFLRTTLPGSLVYQPDVLRQSNRPGLSSFRLSPVSPAALPANNSAAQNIAFIVKSVKSSSSTAVDTDIISAINSQLFGNVDVSSFNGGESVGFPTAQTSVTPTTAGEVIISYRLNSNTNPPAFVAPWTALNLNVNAVGRLGWQKVTPTTTVTDSYAVPGTQAWAIAMMGLQSNATPVFTSIGSSSNALPTTIAGVVITTGVPVIVFAEFASNSTFSPNLTVSDSLGNTYIRVGEAVGIRSAGPQQAQISIWICTNPTGGTATLNLGGSSAGISGTVVDVFKVTGLSGSLGSYTFQASDSTKLVQFRGAANFTGVLPNPALGAGWQAVVSNNGTGNLTISTAGPPLNFSSASFVIPPGGFTWIFSDGTNYYSPSALTLPLAATLVTHQWLNSYNPVTGQFGQSQPAFSDISGIISSAQINSLPKIPTYNGIATVSNGLPSEYATVDLTVQQAAIGTTTLYAVPALGVGQYRVSWNAKVTQAATTSSVLGALTITYTDPDNVVQTITMAGQNSAGTTETTDTGNTTTTVILGHTLMLNVRQSTNIQYAFAYTSVGATVMQYNLHIKLEAM